MIRVPKLAGDIGSEIEFSKVLAVFSDAGEVLASTETAATAGSTFRIAA